MNQPRYSDHNPSNSSNSRRRGVSHSTGRSNYGGSSSRRSNRGSNNKQGNAIGNWIKNRRQRRQQQNNQQLILYY